MADNLAPHQRRAAMQAVKSKNTSLEVVLCTQLWKQGLRFRRNVQNLAGKPDIAVKKHKKVVFIDSCFWHGCPDHCRMPQTNSAYWQKKIAGNRARDLHMTQFYQQNGWQVLRVWEHDIKANLPAAVERIAAFLRDR